MENKIIQVFDDVVTDELCSGVTDWMDNTLLKDINCEIQEDVIGGVLEEDVTLYEPLKEMSFEYLDKYLSKFMSIPYKLHLACVDVFRYPTGTYCKTHVGQEILDEGSDFRNRFVVAMLFLNDDYEGGNLYFNDHGIVVTPKKKRLAFFPTNFTVPHGVTPVTSGIRDMLGFNFAITLD
jgi:predicted 2-oxoglutarate/Fe(II)-dependent dioxygenase YbiX